MLIAGLALVFALAMGALAVSQPTRVLLPLYALTVPTGSAVELDLPVPPPFNTLSSLLGGGLLLASLVHVLLYRRGRIPRLSVGMWMAFLGWITLTAFWSLDGAQSTEILKIAWPLLLLVAALAILPTDERDLDAFRLGMITAGILLGLYAILVLVSGGQVGDTEEGRVIVGNEGDTDPNILAASLLMPLAISTERVVFGGRRWLSERGWRWFGTAGMTFSLVAILLTGSRGGLLAAIATFITTLILAARAPEGRRIVRRIAVAIAAGSVAIYATFLLGLAFSPEGTFRQLLDGSPISRIPETELGTSGRIEIWLTGYQACLTHCATGSGIGSFGAVFDRTFAFVGAESAVGAQRPAHSIYLSLAVETGLVGLTLLLLAVLVEWRGLRSVATDQTAAVKASILGILVANFFLGAIWFKYFWLAFVYAGLAWSLRDPPSPPPGSDRRLSVRTPATAS